MAEILSIRALMKMHAFEHIPNEGVISSKDLAAKIGAEESLVGLSPSVSTSPSTVVDSSPPIRQSGYIYDPDWDSAPAPSPRGIRHPAAERKGRVRSHQEF